MTPRNPTAVPRDGTLPALLASLVTSRDRLVREWASRLATHGEFASGDGARTPPEPACKKT